MALVNMKASYQRDMTGFIAGQGWRRLLLDASSFRGEEPFGT